MNERTIYSRNCPKCNKEIFYKCEQYLKVAIKKNCICLSCTSKIRAKKALDNRIKNKTLSLNNAYKAWETRRAVGHVESSMRKTNEVRLKNDPNKLTYAKAVETRRKNGKPWHSKETIEKIKNVSIVKMLRNGKWVSVGTNEEKLLNEQEAKNNCKILRQYVIDISCGKFYIVDGYCEKNNTVFEVYERQHNKQIEHDLKRQKEIEDKLNCKFVIIHDNLEN